MFSVALSPGRPESLLATILPFGVRTFLLSPLSGRRGDRLARSGRFLYTALFELRLGNSFYRSASLPFTTKRVPKRWAEGVALRQTGMACQLTDFPDTGHRAQLGEHRLDQGLRPPGELEGLPHRKVAQVEAGETSGGRAYGPQR